MTLGTTRLYSNFGAASVGTYSGQADVLNNVEKVTIETSSLSVGQAIEVKVVTNGLSYATTQKFAVVVTGRLTQDATDVPIPSPTSAPVPLPSQVPHPGPTMVPVFAPTSIPRPLPTSVPTIPPPTSVPVPAPTPLPTLEPTTESTASVAVALVITVSAPPSTLEEAALLDEILTTTGLESSNIENFNVASVQTSRRLSRTNSRDVRRLATYDWAVTFGVVADLNVVSVETPLALASQIAMQLESSTFRAAVTSAIPTVTAFSAVTAAAATRNPSMEPTLAPVASSSSTATAKATKSGGAGPASLSPIFIVIGVLVIMSLVVLGAYKARQTPQKGQVSGEETTNSRDMEMQGTTLQIGQRILERKHSTAF